MQQSIPTVTPCEPSSAGPSHLRVLRSAFFILRSLLLLASLLLTGCVSTKHAATSDVTLTHGKLEATLNAPLAKSAQSTREAFQDLKLMTIAYRVNTTSARLVGLAPATNIRVEVDLTAKDDQTSRLTIGTSAADDDRPLTQTYDAICKRLH